MTNPERSVGECTQEIISQMTGDDLSKDRMSWLIKTALQAERQRCEEVVEEIMRACVDADTKYDVYAGVETIALKYGIALTQPNNPTNEND